MSWLVKSLEQGFGTVTKDVTSAVSTAEKAVSSGVSTAEKDVSSFAQHATQAVSSGISSATQAVSSFAQHTTQAVSQSVGAVASGIHQFIPVVGHAVAPLGQEGNMLAGAFKNIGTGFVKGTELVGGQIQQGASSLAKSISADAGTAIQDITNVGNVIGKTVVSGASALANDVVGAEQAALKSFTSWGQEEASNLANVIKGAQNLGQGLANAVSPPPMGQKVLEWIRTHELIVIAIVAGVIILGIIAVIL
jgi:phage-related protein